MINRRKRPVWKGDGKPHFPKHSERLGAGDLMDEMNADEQLGLAVPQLTNRVRLPYLLKECLSHFAVLYPFTYNRI